MRQLLLVIFTFFTISLAAQRRFATEEKWSASLTGAFIPLPELNMGIQPGVGYRFSDRLSLLTEFTIRVGNKTDKDSTAVNKKYFRIQEELRYIFRNKKRRREDYIGLRLSWATRKFEDVKQGFYSVKDDQGFTYDRAKINSPVFTSSIQFGSLFPIGDKISIDLFLGLGVRFINTTYSDVVNPVAATRNRPPDGPVFYASYSYAGKLAWFHLNTGFRFIYHFGQ